MCEVLMTNHHAQIFDRVAIGLLDFVLIFLSLMKIENPIELVYKMNFSSFACKIDMQDFSVILCFSPFCNMTVIQLSIWRF